MRNWSPFLSIAFLIATVPIVKAWAGVETAARGEHGPMRLFFASQGVQIRGPDDPLARGLDPVSAPDFFSMAALDGQTILNPQTASNAPFEMLEVRSPQTPAARAERSVAAAKAMPRQKNRPGRGREAASPPQSQAGAKTAIAALATAARAGADGFLRKARSFFDRQASGSSNEPAGDPAPATVRSGWIRGPGLKRFEPGARRLGMPAAAAFMSAIRQAYAQVGAVSYISFASDPDDARAYLFKCAMFVVGMAIVPLIANLSRAIKGRQGYRRAFNKVAHLWMLEMLFLLFVATIACFLGLFSEPDLDKNLDMFKFLEMLLREQWWFLLMASLCLGLLAHIIRAALDFDPS